MAFKKCIFEKFGTFRTDLGPHGNKLLRREDSEFCGRVLQAGEKIVYVPSAVVYHPVESERMTKQYHRSFYFYFGRTEVKRFRLPADAVCYFGAPRYLLRKLVFHFLRWSLSVHRGRRFYEQLQVWRILGSISEALSLSRNMERKVEHYEKGSSCGL